MRPINWHHVFILLPRAIIYWPLVLLGAALAIPGAALMRLGLAVRGKDIPL